MPTPALDTEDSDNHNNSTSDGDSTSTSSGVSYPADIHCNYDRDHDKTPFIAADVDPALRTTRNSQFYCPKNCYMGNSTSGGCWGGCSEREGS